jgi:hypothetical protein
MFEGVEEITDALKGKQNLYYIQFVPHRGQHLRCDEKHYRVGSIGKWL